jgi:Uma2 family endonuclease
MATQTKLLTYDDYRTLPNDGKQYEIIEGELLMSPPPTYLHQVISRNLFKVLDQYVSKNKLGEILYAPFDVVLSMRNVVQPDLMYISSERLDIIAENNVVEAPDLVVEILSEATAGIDRIRKKMLYEKYAANEYWIVDPTKRAIEQFILREQALELNGTFDASQSFLSSAIRGFTMPAGKMFPSQ